MVDIASIPQIGVPSGRTPGQFRQADTRIGQATQQIGRATQQLGNVLSGISQQIAATQDAGEVASVDALINEERAGMDLYMQQNQDHTTYEERWGQAQTRIKEAIDGTTRQRTQEHLNKHVKTNMPIWTADVTQGIRLGTIKNTATQTVSAIDSTVTANMQNDTIAANGTLKEGEQPLSEKDVKLAKIRSLMDNVNSGIDEDPVTGEEFLNKNKIWSDGEELAILDKASDEIDRFEAGRAKLAIAELEGAAQGNAFNVWEQSRTVENPDGDLNAALDVLNSDPRVSQANKQEMESELISRVNSRRAEDTLIKDKAEKEDTETVHGWINSNKLDNIVNRINALPGLPEEQKTEMIDTANAHIKSVREGDLSPYSQSNLSLYLDFRSRLVNDPTSVTEQEIRRATGRGLSIANYDSLTRMIPDDSPIKRPSVIRTQKMVERMRTIELADLKRRFSDTDEQGELRARSSNVEKEYLDIFNNMDKWVEQNKDDPQFEEKLTKMAKHAMTPKVEDTTLWWTEGWFRRDAELINETKKDLRGLPEWEQMNSREQQEAEELIDAGWTVQQILDELARI